MSISVCIVSYNTRALLERCLAAVQHEGVEEIVVVDNASSDHSADLVAGQAPRALLIRNPANVNYTRAMNQALAAARGDLLMLLNPDTEPRPGALSALRAALDYEPEWGAAGARLEFPDGTLQRTGNRFPTRRWLLYEALGINARRPQNRAQQANIYADWDRCSARRVDALSGAALLVRREVWAGVGPLDPGFPMYFEEVDWCRRMALHGWDVGYVPEACIVHHSEQSARQLPSARRNRLFETSFIHYARKYYGIPFAALLKLVLQARHLVRGRARA